MDREEYVPRFRVGDTVRAHEGTDREFTATIVERIVCRDKEPPSTFYIFHDDPSTWEAFLTPTTDNDSTQ